jgi:hypothetical protein
VLINVVVAVLLEKMVDDEPALTPEEIAAAHSGRHHSNHHHHHSHSPSPQKQVPESMVEPFLRPEDQIKLLSEKLDLVLQELRALKEQQHGLVAPLATAPIKTESSWCIPDEAHTRGLG